ncbi:DUF5317 domain-containing protein [Candidatus Acetothermia bacterium]|jgi:hypothetical protein|nr:DUF5317 domain-containing protein [Candidatus Acetothermia bacterium]MCI2430974.1 DUF5317 domain-containing protein [Candidatus Acetothermia bacterium]MCI2437222.1 DUF5317 domain-containing protein [Candidatus Acetothermia bacterium]
MVLLWAILLGLLIGLLRRGSLANLAKLDLRAGGLVLLAMLLQILIFPLGQGAQPIIPWGTEYFHIASYIFLLLFVVINHREWALWTMALGMLSNFVVIAANGGYMPASIEALRAAGKTTVVESLLATGRSGNVITMNEQTNLNFLGDLFWLPAWVPLATAFSIGDILLAMGIIWLLQAKLRG